jgi:Pectin methylesterase
MKRICAAFVGLFMLSNLSFGGQKINFTVSQDGKANFKTVQEAIDAVPENSQKRTVIFIKNGIYKEKLTLPENKINVTFIGENAGKTILTYDDYASKPNAEGKNMGTTGSSSFFVNGDGFRAENITFENSSGPVGQAVAVRIEGDRVSFFNCRFLGFQDTLYPHGEKSREYFKNCYIEGTVDFIFGFATVFFEDCHLFCKQKGYVTAASTPEGKPFGFAFKHCKIDGSAEAGAFCLGRPWRPFAKVLFMECEISNVIKAKGWTIGEM